MYIVLLLCFVFCVDIASQIVMYDLLFLSMVHLQLPPFSVAIKIDRVYSIEHVEALGFGLPSIKTFFAVDVVAAGFVVSMFPSIAFDGHASLLLDFFIFSLYITFHITLTFFRLK